MSDAGCKQNAAFYRDRIRRVRAASSKRAVDARRWSGNAHRLDARFHGWQRAGCKQPGHACANARRSAGPREESVYKRIIHHGHVFKEAAVRQHGRRGGLNKVESQNQRVSLRSSAAVDGATLVPDLNKAGSSCVIPDDAAAIAKVQPAAIGDGGDELVRRHACMNRQELELQDGGAFRESVKALVSVLNAVEEADVDEPEIVADPGQVRSRRRCRCSRQRVQSYCLPE